MSEFTIRSESVDVEQIMKQIRARILEKRGADYTEDQIRELASVRLEKFLDAKNLRSDLLEQFRRSRPALAELPPMEEPPTIEAPYAFDDQTLFTSHRGPMRLVRTLLRPLLKLFFNPNTLNYILHKQADFNLDLMKREARRRMEFNQRMNETAHNFNRSRNEWNVLYYEVLHNLVIETTRTGIEMQNLRMRVESLSSRLDFSERRVRALEGVVQYRPEVLEAPARREREDDEPAAPAPAMGGSLEGFVPTGQQGQNQPGQGDGSRKRRRRRRGRRGGAGLPGAPGADGTVGAPGAAGASGASEAEGDYDGPDDADGGDEGFDGETLAAGAAPEATAAAEAPDASAAPDAPASSTDGEQ